MYLSGSTYIDEVAAMIYRKVNPEREYFDDRSLYRIYAVLCLGTGEQTTMSDVHNAWVAWKVIDNPGNPYNRPFSQLSPIAQEYDREFMQAIREVAQEIGGKYD